MSNLVISSAWSGSICARIQDLAPSLGFQRESSYG